MFCTHVDDIFETATIETDLINFHSRIISIYRGRFDDTDDIDAKEYVGMEWERDVKGNTRKLHQSVFCEKLLKDFVSDQQVFKDSFPHRDDCSSCESSSQD